VKKILYSPLYLFVIIFCVFMSLSYANSPQGDETEESIAISTKALAEQGDVLAQVRLEFMYSAGVLGVPLDYAETMKWYRMAARIKK